MCGIIGYIGRQSAPAVILEGLRRLEYRGYDSAGMALIEDGGFRVIKKKGKIDEGLAPMIQPAGLDGNIGLGHTRWATHGAPSDENSHPHTDQSGRIVLVHNGVIENYEPLKRKLLADGHTFKSETDTEVLAHIIGDYYDLEKERDGEGHPLARAVMSALREVIGTYGIGVICNDDTGTMVGARRGSPLIIGIGKDENFLASDTSAMVAHTQQVVFLNDYDVATITRGDFNVVNLGSDTAKVQISRIEFDAEAVEKGDYPHFMLKEIFEQPKTIANAVRGRLDHEEATAKFGGLNMTTAELRAVDRIVIVACGTSLHAGLAAEYTIEELAQIPVEVEYASEFRYRNPPLDKNTLVIAITQSGETADTLAGLRESRRRGHKVLAICNVVGSTIARESDGGIYLHAGPEIGVASTKAFTSQTTVLTLFALLMGRIRMLSNKLGKEIIRALDALPQQVQSVLEKNDTIKQIAEKYHNARNFFYLGRQYNYPVALEGALKLKEISYIHAEGYPAAEMKHGPIALIDENTPTVVLAPSDSLYEKTISNLQEIRARKGPIIAVVTNTNNDISAIADEIITVPNVLEPLLPILEVVPLQLLAYHIAVMRGCDVDKPRNLAKSVTVE
ncbi:MAG: glutamine--fructose-6-phosphate transaminase (isomerizing) [Verrucomicrobia bacterium]|nr:glutamine--fructose-6-phosphate transaminase (isomerizing) [Verrucomicrobiota bacterium]MCF7708574.1 glutamine--fructose-6-phosphate transaminase (isomerizing) [Verrucomicrobiota bacterium]